MGHAHKHHEDELHGSSSWMKRLEAYLPEFVYGSIDGIVTTFAVVAGAAGAGLDVAVIVILGISNLVADGLSMSIGSYLSRKSEQDNYNKHLKIESWEIDHLPEVERQEIEDIYRAKGFEGEELKMVVNRITSNKQVWLETMMKDELNLIIEKKSPFRAGLSTFIAFVFAGSIPLIFYVLASGNLWASDPFVISASVTAATFVLIGVLKNYVTKAGIVRSVAETVLLGAVAALAAYLLGDFLERIIL